MLIEIIFVVLMILRLVMGPWPNSPFTNYAWAGGILDFMLFLCLGLAVWGGYGGGAHLGRLSGAALAWLG